jgi:RNA recognition motif-containing protein
MRLNVFVGNCPPGTRFQDLINVFKGHADVKSASMYSPYYGFVTFRTEADKEKALALNGKLRIAGKLLVIRDRVSESIASFSSVLTISNF